MSNVSASEPAAELARKLNLLLDVIMIEDGRRATYTEVAAWVEGRGLTLSRARWSYMTAGGGRYTSDPELLSAIADFFKIDASYLLGGPDEDLPKRIEAQLQLVLAMRLNKVRIYAARMLGDVSPETLRELTDVINRSAPPPAPAE